MKCIQVKKKKKRLEHLACLPIWAMFSANEVVGSRLHSNDRGGISQSKVNNFSNFRHAETSKQWDKIDNCGVIPWN